MGKQPAKYKALAYGAKQGAFRGRRKSRTLSPIQLLAEQKLHGQTSSVPLPRFPHSKSASSIIPSPTSPFLNQYHLSKTYKKYAP
ncbi:hypothetical protein OIDMADRAFT_19801 [Oidiodendron maius Zn]|uniref:Uncharacterized protein n=1 Tax=Oidiodendron maius (strain Zn) TaxID=913774 RepID=A0A0C3CLJ1_OIDMZ|nr:hypothetical protein OIDMADRAFT_19801 [Oidiodendron maius Zn]